MKLKQTLKNNIIGVAEEIVGKGKVHVISLFKEGDKKNYIGLTLPNLPQKFLTKIILEKILPFIEICEEQQACKHRSTTEAIFVVGKIVEKAIECS